jgi:hypothetical protein
MMAGNSRSLTRKNRGFGMTEKAKANPSPRIGRGDSGAHGARIRDDNGAAAALGAEVQSLSGCK